MPTWRVAVYLETHCNIGSKRAFPTGVLDRWQLFTYLLTRKLFGLCIRRYLVSHACDWLMPAFSAMLLIFSFQFSLFFFNISLARPHQHCGVLLFFIYVFYISDIRRCRKFGRYLSCTEHTAQGKNFEFDSNGKKMETRPKGPFKSEFPAICNHCGVMRSPVPFRPEWSEFRLPRLRHRCSCQFDNTPTSQLSLRLQQITTQSPRIDLSINQSIDRSIVV